MNQEHGNDLQNVKLFYCVLLPFTEMQQEIKRPLANTAGEAMGKP